MNAAERIVAAAAVLTAIGYLVRRWVWPAVRGGWRLAKGTEAFVSDYQESGGFHGLTVEVGKVTNAVAQLGESTHRLEGYAAANREGIADLRDQANDLAKRLTDVDEKADALAERITRHRRANDEQAALLRQRLDRELADARTANEGLRATVHELLAMDERNPS